MKRYRISFAGAGRVADTLCREFFSRGHTIIQIASLNRRSSIELSSACNAIPAENLNFDRECDIIIVAVPDNRLQEVLAGIRYAGNPILAHTAGSFGIEVFPDNILRKGVFYPLQTFSKSRKVNLEEVPFFLEASDSDTMNELRNVALLISGKIYESSARDRQILHLAAVFACNFTNHMYTLAGRISNMTSFGFEVLKPLIAETARKALETGPEIAQTGPAIRNDTDTLKKHLELLSFSEEFKNIYKCCKIKKRTA